MCIKWVRHDMLDKTMQICNKARAEHPKHLDNLCGSQTSFQGVLGALSPGYSGQNVKLTICLTQCKGVLLLHPLQASVVSYLAKEKNLPWLMALVIWHHHTNNLTIYTYLSFKVGEVHVFSGQASLVLAQPGTMHVSWGALSLPSFLANPTARLEFKPGNILKYKCTLGCIMNTTFFSDGMATNLNYRSEKKLSVMKYRSVCVCVCVCVRNTSGNYKDSCILEYDTNKCFWSWYLSIRLHGVTLLKTQVYIHITYSRKYWIPRALPCSLLEIYWCFGGMLINIKHTWHGITTKVTIS